MALTALTNIVGTRRALDVGADIPFPYSLLEQPCDHNEHVFPAEPVDLFPQLRLTVEHVLHDAFAELCELSRDDAQDVAQPLREGTARYR